MKSKKWVAVAAAACFVLTPVGAFAQQAPDGASVNEAPAAGPQAAVDMCGNTPESSFGTVAPDGTPQSLNTQFPKDATGAESSTNLSSVTGKVLHVSGNLMLLAIPMEPATGMDQTTVPTPDKSLAVVRLPSGCQPDLSAGSQVTAEGVPSPDGILNVERLETA